MEKFKNFYQEHKNRIDFVLPIFYLFLLVLGFLYIQSVLNSPEVEVQRPPKKEEVEERNEKEIDVTLIIIDEQGNLLNSYTYKIENKKTVDDLMQELRSTQNMFYEKVVYLDGLRVEQLLQREIPQKHEWQVYLENKNVTDQIEQVTFIDNQDARAVKIVLEPTK